MQKICMKMDEVQKQILSKLEESFSEITKLVVEDSKVSSDLSL